MIYIVFVDHLYKIGYLSYENTNFLSHLIPRYFWLSDNLNDECKIYITQMQFKIRKGFYPFIEDFPV